VRWGVALRSVAAGAILVGSLALSTATRADSASVPVGLQVELFAKVADYDKTLPGRAEGVVRVVVVTRGGVPESTSAAARVLNALSNMSRISGLPHEDSSVQFTDAASLATLCRDRTVGILYMTPGLTDVDDAVARALAGVPVLTVSATADGVPKGIVLGFDLVGAKPKLLVNLTSCRNQNVRLSSDVLKISTVIE
jgi:uncharacterized protein DUF4154